MTVQRFRETFPRARWSEERKAWFVPGSTAGRRIDRWLAREASRRDVFADQKGRDAYAFEPILSPYLSIDNSGFRIRTPYSPTIVEELRQVPFAQWQPELKVWRVPFASYDDLRRHWQAIEEAARRNEPEERRKRAEARKGTEEERTARRRSAERRRRRIPLWADDLPPIGRPISTTTYGIIIVTEITGEVVDAELVADVYPDATDGSIWGRWRVPGLNELVRSWPSKTRPGAYEVERGWWQPTIEELREARRRARAKERKTRTA
ncbi:MULTISPECIES: hypothetical protein [unclassified Sinorhizobium]|uniref:hypothetical protein n=1 Tax=unclassified Sinorhizobium TaxID=2613772 RepID=UPI0024C22290|nr:MULTISPECIES: hypothetical protein [unclassified Sinorhizobium]MDK1374171.1 hypothetical protein [Sinorhizobium sp. 6-70]MDK1480393.1 hypothetical protein [Sinorhizobium sp. 6-117]